MVNFEIIYKDASVYNYSYPAEMKDKMRNFWKRLYSNGEITGWAIV